MDISTLTGASVEFKQTAEDGVMWMSQTTAQMPSHPLGALLMLGLARRAEDASQKELTLTAVETLHREEHCNLKVPQTVQESVAEMETAKLGR